MDDLPIVILGSARKKSDTRKFVENIFNDIDHELIDLLDFNISYYDYKHKNKNDDFIKVTEQLIKHKIIVFATPVYWYSMSANMKTFFDRLSDLVTIRKEIGRQLKDKHVFLITFGTGSNIPEGFEIPFQMSSEYLGMKFDSSVYGYYKNGHFASVALEKINNFKERIITLQHNIQQR